MLQAGDASGAILVESGVPYPRRSEARRWPWNHLAPGQSFIAPEGATAQAIHSSFRRWRRQEGLVGARIGTSTTMKGIRVWRLT